MGGGFFGALALIIGALILHLGRAGLPGIGAALLLYAITVGITLAVNVPLNDAIKAVGDVDRWAVVLLGRTQQI